MVPPEAAGDILCRRGNCPCNYDWDEALLVESTALVAAIDTMKGVERHSEPRKGPLR